MLIENKPSQALRFAKLGQLVEPRVQNKHEEFAFSCYAVQCTQMEEATHRSEFIPKCECF